MRNLENKDLREDKEWMQLSKPFEASHLVFDHKLRYSRTQI